MLNIEKYKKEIALRINAFDYNLSYATLTLMKYLDPNVFEGDCENKALKILDWLTSEYKEPVLTEKEKEYLSAVIKPFKDMVIAICKASVGDSLYEIEIYYRVGDGDKDVIALPIFNAGTMYKGMQMDRYYDLKELDLC